MQATKSSFIITLDHRRENQSVFYYFQKENIMQQRHELLHELMPRNFQKSH